MNQTQKINHELQRLVAQGDWRFAVGLRIRFNHPTLLFQTYPEAWVAIYAQRGLLFSDPAVAWGMTHFGLCTWAELESQDAAGVLALARTFGLNHGITVSVGDGASRSIGFFTHSDRPIDAEEQALAADAMTRLHAASEGVAELDVAALARLAALGDGLRTARA